MGADGVQFDAVKPQGGVSPALVHTSRGLAVGDVNNDGGLDLVITNRDAAPYLLINTAERGNFVRFRVVIDVRDAYGATVSATVGSVQMHRDVQPSASYLASSDPSVHFGLDSASKVESVTVRWPGGTLEAFGDFKAGDIYELQQGAGKPEGSE